MVEYVDIKKTGKRLEELIDENGYTVKEIQTYLHLTCPQSVYRWYKGVSLPTIPHLYRLSILLKIPMEDMIVVNKRKINSELKKFLESREESKEEST